MRSSSRQALSFQEKDALRQYKLSNPTATQRACQDWFYSQFSKRITQSTISEILASKKPRKVKNPNRQRDSSPIYPELEPVLYEKSILFQQNGNRLTYPILQQLAYDAWDYVYGLERDRPNISVGMMQRFAIRNDFEVYSSRSNLVITKGSKRNLDLPHTMPTPFFSISDTDSSGLTPGLNTQNQFQINQNDENHFAHQQTIQYTHVHNDPILLPVPVQGYIIQPVESQMVLQNIVSVEPDQNRIGYIYNHTEQYIFNTPRQIANTVIPKIEPQLDY